VIKILKSDFNSVAFSTESLSLYPLSARVADSLSGDEEYTSKQLPEEPKGDPINNGPAKINRLTLMIAQTCNLKCSYCFAETYMGPYSEDRIMSSATACAAIKKVFKITPGVQRIVFFGGEPLMGFTTIKKAVQTSEEYCRAHQLQMPAFSITTNGALIDQKVIEFFKRHHFSVTVSLDGPRRINDRQRQFLSGKGTYDLVKKKIDLLRGAGLDFGIEAVFTDNHRKCKETIESTYEFLLKLGARNICLTPAIGGPRDECLEDFLVDLEQSYTASTERIMDSWLTDSPIIMPYWRDILYKLISRKGQTQFCGAGYEGITVDCSGKVFPCHTLMSNSLYMGSVYDKKFPGENFRRVTALMRRTSKNSFPKCVKCWAKKLCSPCYGDTFSEYGNLSAPRESICIIIRSVAKSILLKVAEFMSEEEKWKRFDANIDRPVTGFDIDRNKIIPMYL
jgi:uncharacterized protein